MANSHRKRILSSNLLRTSYDKNEKPDKNHLGLLQVNEKTIPYDLAIRSKLNDLLF